MTSSQNRSISISAVVSSFVNKCPHHSSHSSGGSPLWGGPHETTGAGGRFVEILIRKSKHSQSRKIRQGTNPQGHWLKSDWNFSTERLQEQSGLLCHYWRCSMCNMFQSSRYHTNKLSTHISTKSSSIIFQCMIKRCQSVGNQFYNFWK